MFTAQASESTCPQCPPGELGWGFPSAAEGGPVPQRSSKKLLQRYRTSRTVAVPSIHVRASLYLSASPRIQYRATRAPCKEETPGTCSFPWGETRLRVPPRESPSEEQTLSISAKDEASGREGKGQRDPGSPEPSELRLEATAEPTPGRVLTRGHSRPTAPRGLARSQSHSRAAPPRSGAAVKAPQGPGHRPASARRGEAAGQPRVAQPKAAQPRAALPRAPGTCGPAEAPPAAPSGAAPAPDTGCRP